MEKQLLKIAKSYDNSIELGKKGIDNYKNLPKYITSNPDYIFYKNFYEQKTVSDSADSKIIKFLVPERNMKFIDLGCCLNLMFAGYSNWKSIYYGVDISSRTIELLNEFVYENNLSIGGLFCGEMHKTPYENDFFDIGSCIGCLQYFEFGYVKATISEIFRIVKTDAKVVLDIPDIGSPEAKIAGMIEKFLGREDKFNLSIAGFEKLLAEKFNILKKEKYGPMLQYFLTKC